MGRLTIMMKIGFIWAIISFLSGCAQTQESMVAEIESQNKMTVEAQQIKIDQLSTKLIESEQANLALKTENSALKTAKLWLMYTNTNLEKNRRELRYRNRKLRNNKRELMKTNRELEKDNQELAMKIDMLKVLDHRVEEKRKNYSSN
jgi:hypothetical protein